MLQFLIDHWFPIFLFTAIGAALCFLISALMDLWKWATEMTPREERYNTWARQVCRAEFAARPVRSRLDGLLRRLILWSPFGINVILTPEETLYLARAYLYPLKIADWLKRHPDLHCIWRSDDPKAWHNHPWEESDSYILEAGYLDHRPEGKPSPEAVAVTNLQAFGSVQNTYKRKRGDHVKIYRTTFHRLELTDGHAWTLFVTGSRVPGPKDTSWGFIEVGSGEYMAWEAYLKQQKREQTQRRSAI